MNDSYEVCVGIKTTKLVIALLNNQDEASEAFLSTTLPQRNPDSIIADSACGINSQSSQGCNGGGLCLASFDMIFSGALEVVKKHGLPHSFQELQVLSSKQPSSAFGFTSLVWYFEKSNRIN
jgi:hypothetical protein